VGWLPSRADLKILDEYRWYRIRDNAQITTSDRWPPRWFAALEAANVSRPEQQVLRFAEVLSVERQARQDLFPIEAANEKSSRSYLVLNLGPIQTLPQPLVARRPRRTTFIETTIGKLTGAAEFNDIFNDSPYEDDLWAEMKALQLRAERQWPVTTGAGNYVLDFAIFCRDRKLDVEVDGRMHHIHEDRSIYDAGRDRELAALGWVVNRFLTREVSDDIDYCLRKICETVERNGGIEDPALLMRRYKPAKGVDTSQLSFGATPDGGGVAP
jgi:very-short-patch-repair endonuclease